MSALPNGIASPSGLPSRTEFDEDAYLRLHPDVAEAAYAGIVGSAWQHFTLHGFAEGRQWVRKTDPMAGVSREIAAGDEMYSGNEAHYLDTGESALHCIQTALFAARRPRSSIKTILDLPCGHGRVMRFLKKNFPEAQLTACDLNADGVSYCANTFGADPVISHVDPREIPLNGPFDLIWCGSLLTHLSKGNCAAFIERFEHLLRPDGITVFTTHGRHCALELKSGKNRCGLNDQQISRVLDEYEATGFGFVEYESQPAYGISLSQPSFVFSSFVQPANWQLLGFHENGWDRRQDVTCLKKVRAPR